MTDHSRGAASVTLDTIIWEAVTGLINEEEEQIVVRAVTDTLLAKGSIDHPGWLGYERLFGGIAPRDRTVLVIPLEAS